MRAPAIAALALCAATTSWAGPKEDARAAYDAGVEAYRALRYLEAASKFEAAYALDPDPGFLFNIAQSYRLGRSCKKAIEYYDRFSQAVPNPPEPEALQRYRYEAVTCASSEPAPAPRTRVVERDVPFVRRWTTWAIPAGASAGVAIVFAVVGARAKSKVDEIRDCGVVQQENCPFTYADALRWETRGKRDNLISYIALGATGGFAVTAVIMKVTEPARFVVVPDVGPDQVGLSITGRL